MNVMRNKKLRYLGAKRLMLEAQEQIRENSEHFYAQPLDDDLFEWHFTVRGPPDTPFEAGYYHGRLIFPTDYPMKPPSVILLTPNGRFDTNRKICLSISGHHPETWQPSWSVRTALLAFIAFMPSKANGAIGSLNLSDAERRNLALKSQSWTCEMCGLVKDLLKKPAATINSDQSTSQEANKLDKTFADDTSKLSTSIESCSSERQIDDTNQSPDVNTSIIDTSIKLEQPNTELNTNDNLANLNVDSHQETHHQAQTTINLVNEPRSSSTIAILMWILVALIIRRVIFVVVKF